MFFIIFLPKLTSAQEVQAAKPKDAAVMYVGNAEVYSADEDFNKQIREKKIIVKGAKIISGKTRNKNQLVLTGKREKKSLDKSDQDKKVFAERKKNEALPKERLGENKVKKVYLNISPNYFFVSQTINKDCAASGCSCHNVPKAHCNDKDLSLNRSLHFLYANAFDYYRNESSDVHFLGVFFVRPPPRFI